MIARIFSSKLALCSAVAAIVVHGGTIMSILEALAEEKKAFYDWQVGNAMGYHLYISDETWKKRQRLTVLEKIT